MRLKGYLIPARDVTVTAINIIWNHFSEARWTMATCLYTYSDDLCMLSLYSQMQRCLQVNILNVHICMALNTLRQQSSTEEFL